MKHSCALLIPTYNQPKQLELILMSIEKQSESPNEILIADDGSGSETKDIIDNFRKKSTLNIKHIWIEDKGFRKSIALNKAVAAAESDYIMQIDGDCILHPEFVKDHKENAKKGQYLYGTRVHVRQQYVPTVVKNKKFLFSFFDKGLKKRPRAIRNKFLSSLFKEQETISPKFRGCNTSFWRDDFILVNGYNEDFNGWGREDSELMIRLHNNGIVARRLKFSGLVYHLDHTENSKSRFEINDNIQEETISKKLKRCENGVDKYLL